MIALDTSALVAIFLAEPEAERFSQTIARARTAIVATPTTFEFLMVALGKKGEGKLHEAYALLAFPAIETVDWGAEMTSVAFDAHRQFGKGYHPAALNFGDCMSYALAKSRDLPLLYKGDDFARTDIRSALD